MNKKHSRVLGAGLICLSLLAASCGGGDDGESGSAGTVDANINNALKGSTTTEAAGSTTPTTAAAPLPTTMDGWEKLWVEQRAAVVARAKSEGWGLSADGKSVKGPEGFTIDMSKCPAGWSNTEGLTDTTVKLGQAIAQSGTFADYNNYARGMKTIFDYYGAAGAFKDSLGKTRTIDYIVKDDGYDPARTIPIVDELIDSDRVFAVWTLGTPSTMKVYGKLNERCIPHPFAMTAHPAWGDPVNHPWTTGAPAPSYATEAILWGSFLEERADEFPDKMKVAALVMNNDFGKVYDQTFKAYVAQSDLLKDKVEFTSETIEAQAPTVKDPMTTLAAGSPDVFIAMLAATPCTQTVIEASENGMKESAKYLFQPFTCSGTSFVSKEKVGGDGSASNGWWIFNPGAKDLRDKSQANDAFVAWMRTELTKVGIDPDSSSLLGAGMGGYGWSFVQSLIIAGQLEGGLTRTNFALAMRGLDMDNAYTLPGIREQLNGNKDAFAIEGGVFQQFDSASQAWVTKSDVIELNGKSQNCAWDQATSKCG